MKRDFQKDIIKSFIWTHWAEASRDINFPISQGIYKCR